MMAFSRYFAYNVCMRRLRSLRLALLQLFEDGASRTAQDVARSCDIARGSLHTTLTRLDQNGLLRRRGRVYWITKAGRAALDRERAPTVTAHRVEWSRQDGGKTEASRVPGEVDGYRRRLSALAYAVANDEARIDQAQSLLVRLRPETGQQQRKDLARQVLTTLIPELRLTPNRLEVLVNDA
jgi:hypothetical protein